MSKHLLKYQTCNQIGINNSDCKVNITLEINNVKNIIDDFYFSRRQCELQITLAKYIMNVPPS
jgi:hypothetical protein